MDIKTTNSWKIKKWISVYFIMWICRCTLQNNISGQRIQEFLSLPKFFFFSINAPHLGYYKLYFSRTSFLSQHVFLLTAESIWFIVHYIEQLPQRLSAVINTLLKTTRCSSEYFKKLSLFELNRSTCSPFEGRTGTPDSIWNYTNSASMPSSLKMYSFWY